MRRSGRRSRSIAGHQLELVVLHPDGGALGGDLGDGVGEPLVDLDVGLPPVPVELRRRDDVVVERPQRGVGEALVVVLDLLRGQRRRGAARGRPSSNGSGASSGVPGQPTQAPPRAAQHRRERGDQPAGAALPLGRAVGEGFHVDRQPVGHHHEVGHRVGPYGLEPPTTGSVPPVPRTMTRTPV